MLDVHDSSSTKPQRNILIEILNNNAKFLNNNSAKKLHSVSSDKSINSSETLNTKEVVFQPLELPAPKNLIFTDTEERKT